ncbi:hypothetical protein SASPL_108042 [Salvia splendens]|uniref:ABC transporter domain-containing protein n=1 Tax=Salvia splendens TaxID=180675 RepID=A0A8X8YCC8_SALSN|nr:hypothetical protein SASPL_108042 [Salvia splendens]
MLDQKRPRIDSDEDTIHRFGPNSFKLQSLPVQVLGLVGNNGIGKSTALKLLSGKAKLNLGRFNAICKPQYVDHLSKFVRGNVGQLLSLANNAIDVKQEVVADLDLIQVMNRNVEDLSGGELQRFAIASAALQNADIYFYVIVVEHDLSVLDYLSDFICCLYGKPGKYGAVTLPFSRLHRKVTCAGYKYPTRTRGNFTLRVVEGEFTDSQIIVMLGENGTGKSTFVRILAGLLKPDPVEGLDMETLNFNVSYKPQRIGIKLEFECSVKMLLHAKIPDSISNAEFLSNVFEPLSIQKLTDKELGDLSGGEMQVVALTLCLGMPADIYLIDEPSTYLDSEHCIVASNVIKKFIRDGKKTAFVVEHDFTMSTYLADRVIVYEGKPSIDCVANSPQSVLTGMNLFLSHLDITLRRDSTNLLPRINKHESIEDREQMAAGSYYYMDN